MSPRSAREGTAAVLRRIAAFSLLCSFALWGAPASALSEGEPPALLFSTTVNGQAQAAGNTLMLHDGTTNFALIPGGSQANLGTVDPDATIVQATLFWAGSSTILGEDPDVDFTLPDGTFLNDLSVNTLLPGEPASAISRCTERVVSGNAFFSCRRDVTFPLQQLGAGGAGGIYTVADVQAMPGNCAVNPGTCQAMFAGWALVIMWESPTHPVVRDLVLHDAFFAVDEQNGPFSTGISPPFVLDSFLVGEDALVEFTFFGLEGDNQLGNPPQDNIAIGPTLFCPSCPDFIELSGGGGTARLSDPVNPSGNVFNGSDNGGGGPHPGIDIDTFDLGPNGLGVLGVGDTTLTMTVGSGDGLVGNGDPGAPIPDPGGSGELVMLGFTLLSLETLAPQLDGPGTTIVVNNTTASPGDTLTYTLTVANSGADDALGVRLLDNLPAGLSYVPSSTTNTCGVNSADVAGTSPLLNPPGGLLLGDLAPGGSCQVTFSVTIDAGVAGGTVLANFGAVRATDVPEHIFGPANTTVLAAEVQTPEKTVAVVSGGMATPGSSLIYTIRIPNTGDAPATSVSVNDTLPGDLENLAVVALPPGATNASAGNTLTVTNITVPANSSVDLLFTADIRSGTPAGTIIENQADVVHGANTLLTDDPAQPGASDPTRITVETSVDITTSSKAVIDLDGPPTIPGDVLEYTITVNQTGDVPLTVTIGDDLPANVQGCTVVSVSAGGFANCNPGGANGTGRIDGTVAVLAAGTAEVVFQVNVAPTAPDGFTLVNQATLTPLQDPASLVTVQSPPLEVFARPVFTTSQKFVTDLDGGDVRPGDVLRYDIVVENSGPVAASNLVVTDTLDPNLEFVSVAGGGTFTDPDVSWAVGPLATGANVTLSFEARVRPGTPNGTVIPNLATVSADAPAQPFTTAAANVTVVASPIVDVQKLVTDLNGAPFRPGDTVRYSITVLNSGDGAALDVEVRDTLPANLVNVAFPAGGQLLGGEVVFNDVTHPTLSALPPGDSIVLEFDADIVTPLEDGTLISNQAFTTGANVPGTIPSDNPNTAPVDDPTNFAVESQAVLTLEKTFIDENGPPLLPGERVEFVLTVQNTGDAPASPVELRDPLDPRLTFVDSINGGLLVGNEVRFTQATTPALAAVLPGNPVEVRFRVDVDFPLADGTTIDNQATAQSPDAAGVVSDDPTTPVALDPTTLLVESRPVLDDFAKALTDLDGDGVFNPGDRIRYTFTFTNAGTENATNLVLTDPLPAELTNVTVSDGGTVAGNVVTYNPGTTPALASVVPGQAVTLFVEADIVRPLGNAIVVLNQATLASAELPDVLSDDPATAAADDPTAFTVTSFPNLVVQKRVTDANGAPVEPGDTLEYEITIENIGDRAADDVTITDAIHPSLTNLVPQDGGVFAAGTLTYNPGTTPALASVAIDTVVTVRFSADVVVPTANGTSIDNQASVAPAEPGIPGAPFLSDDPDTPAPGDATRVTVVSGPLFATSTLESFDSGGAVIDTAAPGDLVRYELVVENTGNANGDNTTVDIPLPPTLTITSAPGGQVTPGLLHYDGGTLAALAALPVGGQVTITFDAQIAFPLPGGTLVSLQAAISADGLVAPNPSDDPSTGVLDDPTVLTIVANSDLSTLSKVFVDVNGAPAEPGDVIQYVLNVENTGNAPAANVVVVDPLPAELEFVASSTGGIFAAGNVVFASPAVPGLAQLNPGDPPIELRFEARILAGTAAGTLVNNQAVAQDDGGTPALSDDPTTAPLDDPTTFEVETVPGLTVTKQLVAAGGKIVAPGDPVTYLFTITASGSQAMAASTFTDTVPNGIVNVVPGPGLNLAGNTLSANVPPLLPGQQHLLSFTANIDDAAPNGLSIENQSTVNTAELGDVLSDDPDTAVPGDPTVALVEAFPELSQSRKVAVDVNGGLVQPGDLIEYTITVENGGNGQAREVEISDTIDAANLEVVDVQNGGTLAGNTILWTDATNADLVEVAPGGEVSVVFIAQVRAGVADGTNIDNQAFVDARDLPAPVPTDDPATAAVDDATRVTVQSPILTFTKVLTDLTSPTTSVRPGDQVRYDILISNNGTGAATNVVVTDILPPRLTDAVATGGTIAGGQATWTVGTVPSNSTTTLTLSGTIDPLAVGGELLRNQAELAATELAVPRLSDDPAAPGNADPTDRNIDAEEEYGGTIALFNADTGAPIVSEVMPGQRIRVDLNVQNTGSQAGQGVVVRIPFIPSFFRLDESPNGVLSPEGTEMRWTASNVPELLVLLPGDGVSLTATGAVAEVIPDGTNIPVSAFVTSALALPQGLEWEIGPATLVVDSAPRLGTSTKTVLDENGGLVEPGDVLEYAIEVINDGGARADNVIVQDPAPAGTVFIPGTLRIAGVPVVDTGDAPLANGYNIGEVDAQRSVEVRFKVRVHAETVRGFEIRNQALLSADGAPDAVTDNPLTPLILGDPTTSVVGGGPLLLAQKTASSATVAQGGTVTFQIAVENAGTDFAEDVFIVDAIDDTALYVPGTIAVDGTPVTDANDGDAATFFPNPPRVEVRRDRLEAGEGMLVTFSVTAESAAAIVNQGEVSASSLLPTLTDANPGAPGAQATVVPITGTRALLIDDDTTVLRDADGGVLLPGDALAGSTAVLNQGAESVRVNRLVVSLSARIVVDEAALAGTPFTFDANQRALRVSPASLPDDLAPGDTFALPLPPGLSVDPDTPIGEQVRILSETTVTTFDGQVSADLPVGRGELTVGLMDGTGAVSGIAFVDGAERNGTFEADTDVRAKNFQLLAFRDGRSDAVRTAVTSSEGVFQLLPLPAGVYRIEARTDGGALFASWPVGEIAAGDVQDRDLRIDPSGVVYRSSTFTPVRGTRVFLYRDDGDDDLTNDALVPPDELLDGQQGQFTTQQGFYRFDPRPGDYRLGVEPESVLFSFPSGAIAPEREVTPEHPFGDVATPAPDGRVVAQSVPTEGQSTRYFLRFSLSEDAPPVLNNHVPLDSLRDALRIQKTANKRKLSVGDLVAYTVRIDNPSGAGISRTGDGGVQIVDTLPPGFRLVDSWLLQRIETDSRGQARRVNEAPGLSREGQQLVFGPFDLRPNVSYELRYHVVVGPGAKFGDAENRAALRLADGQVPLTDTARARVRVIPDPLFDLGTLRAKVYCDDDGDGWQDKGEVGLGGTRVYLDTGYYADADITGKVHFTGIPPGMHLAKVDTNTLPPGAEMVEDERENFYISAGLPAQVAFPVRCTFDRIAGPTSIIINEDAYRVDEPPTPTREVTVRSELSDRRVVIDGEDVAVGSVQLGVALEGQDPVFGRGPGQNLPAPQEGALTTRLAFVPRADVAKRVVGWKLTVQRDQLVDQVPEVLADPVDNTGRKPGRDLLARRADQVVAAAAAQAGDAGPGPDAAAAGADAGPAETPGPDAGPGAAGDAGARADDSATVKAAGPRWVATPVYVFAGEGALPDELLWDGKDKDGQLLLEAGARYGAVLSVTVEGGDTLSSTERPFGVAYGALTAESAEKQETFASKIDAVGGRLFYRGDKPTKRLIAHLKQQIEPLLKTDAPIEVHVHVDRQRNVAAAALTSRRAAAVVKALLALGIEEDRMVPMGEGDALPLVPNLRQNDRKKNRRVELKVVEDKKEHAPVLPLSWPGEFLVNRDQVPLVPGQMVVEVTREVNIGSVLVVEVKSKDGGRTVLRRTVREEGIGAAGEAAADDQLEEPIQGGLADGNVTWRDKAKSLDLLKVRLAPRVKDAEGRGLAVLRDGQVELGLLPQVPDDVRVLTWTVRLLEELPVVTGTAPAEGAAAARDEADRVIGADAGPAPDAGAAPDAGPGGADAGPEGADAGRAVVEGPGRKKPLETPTKVVRLWTGTGDVAEEISWDGLDDSGQFVADTNKRYVARLVVEALGGDVGVSPDLPVIAAGPDAAVADEETVLAIEDGAFNNGRLKNRTKRTLRKKAKDLVAGDAPIRVVVHTDDRGPAASRMKRTEVSAEAARQELIRAGVPEARVQAVPRGDTEPLRPNLNDRTRKKNRRILILVGQPPRAEDAGTDELARVLANGRPLQTGPATFTGQVPRSKSGEVALMVRTTGGARALLRLRPEPKRVWQGRPEVVLAQLEQAMANRPAVDVTGQGPGAPPTSTSDAGVLATLVGQAHRPDAGPQGPDAGAPRGADAGAAGDAGPAGDAGALLVGQTGQSDAGPGGDAGVPGGDGGTVDSDAGVRPGGGDGGTGPDPTEPVPYAKGGVAPYWWPSRGAVPAMQLSVDLPKEGEVIKARHMVIRGQTALGNVVRIQGKEVPVDEEGRFEALVKFQNGTSELVIEAEDKMGNKGRISRLIEVDTNGWFLLMMADTAVGQDGAQLDERGRYTSYTIGDYFVYGRGVAYVKGQLQSDYVFRDLDLTLHVDTRRWADETFVRDVFEPDLYYPVYGDSSVEWQDAQAMYPLYFKLKADQSEIYVGNLRTTLEGGDLLRYTRARYGAQVVLDRGWSGGIGWDRTDTDNLRAPEHDPWRTQAKVFGAGGASSNRHARVELMGTGGAVYYLRHENVIEGSERIAFIVRDAVTGAEIARAPQQRNLDYTIRYGEGRVIFKEPIPAYADYAFVTNHNFGQTRAGHRVYVEVEYDHDGFEAFSGWAAGGQVKQTLFGHAEVGAGYVYESREDGSPAYQLFGIHAKAFLDEGSYVKGEFAWSQSVDAGNFVSYDGGLSYRGLGQQLDDGPVLRDGQVFAPQRQGWAVKVDGQYQFGELVGRKAQDGLVRAYFHRQSPGFFAGASIVEQGQWKWGSELRWNITDNDLLRLRYDGIVAEIPEVPHVTNARLLHRQLATLSYERILFDVVRLGAEYGGGLTWDSGSYGPENPQPRFTVNNVVAGKLEWQVFKDLNLGIRQEVIVSADGAVIFLGGESTQFDSWNDHLVTHATARYNLTDTLQLSATESIRWNGENQTALGLSWKVNDNSRVYANERLGMTQQGFTSTTVIGGEQQMSEASKTYAEYQLQSGFSGQQSRGVVGMKNRLKLPFGFALSFGYERTQVLGGNVTPNAQGAPPPGAFTDGTFFAMPGANGGGDYLYGAGSRDALSFGVEYARNNVRASQRFELRYDNFDEDRGGRDRLWALSMTNFQWAATPSMSILARYNVALAQDLTLGMREAHLEEGLLGLSYRPVTHDWMSLWAKVSRRVEVRPLSLKEGLSEEYSAHAVSVEPIFELPWKFQLVEKVAFKHASSLVPSLPRAHAFTVLWINRINWHALGTIRSLGINPYIPGDIDFGVEYRLLYGITAATLEHGTLFEVQYAPVPYFRLGIGWNFTRFTDNELDRNNTDNSGFFIRAVGQY